MPHAPHALSRVSTRPIESVHTPYRECWAIADIADPLHVPALTATLALHVPALTATLALHVRALTATLALHVRALTATLLPPLTIVRARAV
eukprot:1630579-Prymnesium_polylepis.1